MYVLRFREHLSVEFLFCVLPAGKEGLIRQKRNGNSVGISGERIRCFTPFLYFYCFCVHLSDIVFWTGRQGIAFGGNINFLLSLTHLWVVYVTVVQKNIRIMKEVPQTQCLGVGSAITNGREPRSCLCRVFNFKLGSFT